MPGAENGQDFKRLRNSSLGFHFLTPECSEGCMPQLTEYQCYYSLPPKVQRMFQHLQNTFAYAIKEPNGTSPAPPKRRFIYLTHQPMFPTTCHFGGAGYRQVLIPHVSGSHHRPTWTSPGGPRDDVGQG